jgi:putative membrane protein
MGGRHVRRFLVHWLVAAIALYVAVRLVPGLSYDGAWQTLAGMALVFGFLNAVVRPILTILTCPLQILTLGLFSLVLNAVMLLLAVEVGRGLGIGFQVASFGSAFLGALVVGIVTLIMNVFMGEDERRGQRHKL